MNATAADMQKLKLDRMQLVIGEYLPIIEELQLTPSQLRELFTSNNGDTANNDTMDSEVEDEEYN